MAVDDDVEVAAQTSAIENEIDVQRLSIRGQRRRYIGILLEELADARHQVIGQARLHHLAK